ncbi:tellurium resistance protein TerC [Chryseobacterium sp. PBS4-4]|uniref:Tellurium resistance protein TerC n=1 Tax=Chryseobacterium edaphi TaxID=2976532 RepID=A0ABT2W8E2_9FLAO|nr:MauE/DoxX family redox-associated membrane protein [Chryseobacterium edaphi]MCU7618466.1 tellurium resistance protein TerC [Chryseobacterium edaphi]
MKNRSINIPLIIAYFFILLFLYAAVSKILDFENFQVQIGQSPLLSAYAGIISYSVILVEIVIALLLSFERYRKTGLYASTALMSSFTIYIYLILNYSDFVPCSCGGILEKLGWTEHLIFNLVCVVLGIVAIISEKYCQGNSMRSSVLIILGTNIISIGMVITLFLSSEYIIKKENNFTRRFLLHPVSETNTLTLDNKDYYFAGFNQDTLYLGNRQYPLSLTTTDTALSKIHTSYLQPDHKQLDFKNISVEVKGTHYYVYDGTVPVIFRGNIGSIKAKTISYQDAYFNSLVVLDSTRFAVRTQSAATQNFILGQIDLRKTPKLTMISGILQKQTDGVFDLDGILIGDAAEKELIYTYAYRNEFIVMDNDMKIKQRLHTIDTVRNAQIRSVALSDGSRKMNQPPLKVNSQSFVYRGLLFNHSVLMGKNESKNAWKKADVIDVYQTDAQMYIGSFYIYRKNNKKLKELYVKDHSMYIIQDDLLTRYHLSEQITKYFRKGEAENP